MSYNLKELTLIKKGYRTCGCYSKTIGYSGGVHVPIIAFIPCRFSNVFELKCRCGTKLVHGLCPNDNNNNCNYK